MPNKLLARRMRSVTGVILFVFAATHLLNHSLGLVSVDAMEAARDWRVAVTRSLIGSVILAGALLIHIAMGIAKFAARRTWRMSIHEAVQLSFGVAIPLLLFKHIIGMRVAHELFGVNDNYIHALFTMWPTYAVTQLGLITLVWLHGCIGIHHLLHMKQWYRWALPVIGGLALLVPVLAFAGFAVAAREVRLIQEWKLPVTQAQLSELIAIVNWSWWGYLGDSGQCNHLPVHPCGP